MSNPIVTITVEIFPEDSILVDRDEDDLEYTPAEVANEAWGHIQDWVVNGFRPNVRVTMPDGTEVQVNLSGHDFSGPTQ